MKRLLSVVVLGLLLTLGFALTPQNAGAYVGQVWSSRWFGNISQYGQGCDTKYEIYAGRTGHIRCWYINRTDPSRFWGQDLYMSTCLTVPGCIFDAGACPPMWDTWNWKIDHVDLVSNDQGGYAGGYILDYGPRPC